MKSIPTAGPVAMHRAAPGVEVAMFVRKKIMKQSVLLLCGKAPVVGH